MRKLIWLVLMIAVATSALQGQAEIFRNDTHRTVTGFWIRFERSVTITAIDETFPHQRPLTRSDEFTFVGWPLRPGGTITIRWAAATTDVEDFGWIEEIYSRSAPEDGIIDAFGDGNVYGEFGVAWTPISNDGGEFRIPLAVDCDNSNCHLLLTKSSVEGMTSVSQHFGRPIDASEFDGLYLQMASSISLAVNVELMCNDPACELGYKFTWVGASAHVSNTIREFRMPFDRFVADAGACPDTGLMLDVTRIQNLGIYIVSSFAGDLMIHEVGFYREDDTREGMEIVLVGGS